MSSTWPGYRPIASMHPRAAVTAMQEAARRANGQFGTQQVAEASIEIGGDGRIWVDDGGDCDSCGHTQEPGKTCENCDPSCPECGNRMESVDQSLCDHCQQREDEDAWYDSDYEDEDEE